jgi:SHS2 domain-containing protein
VTKIDETSVEATLSGEGIDPERHGLRFDVKAATYHALLVEAGAKGFHARVIFDL